MAKYLKISIFSLKKPDSGEIVGEVSGAKIESSMDNTFGDMNFKTDEDEKEAGDEVYQESEEGFENQYAQFENPGEGKREGDGNGNGDVDVSYDFDEDDEKDGDEGEEGGVKI